MWRETSQRRGRTAVRMPKQFRVHALSDTPRSLRNALTLSPIRWSLATSYNSRSFSSSSQSSQSACAKPSHRPPALELERGACCQRSAERQLTSPTLGRGCISHHWHRLIPPGRRFHGRPSRPHELHQGPSIIPHSADRDKSREERRAIDGPAPPSSGQRLCRFILFFFRVLSSQTVSHPRFYLILPTQMISSPYFTS